MILELVTHRGVLTLPDMTPSEVARLIGSFGALILPPADPNLLKKNLPTGEQNIQNHKSPKSNLHIPPESHFATFKFEFSDPNYPPI